MKQYTPLLDTIDSLDQFKAIPEHRLAELANEMRQYLIHTLAPIGGHLGASLGVIELSIALHRVFNSPSDAIIWDVGHQAYAHKMLTGRLQGMPQIRQYGGLSGFTKRKESEHDAFGAGHASTSISAALGMAAAGKLKNSPNHSIAVIGDGALTGGMAFEALNHAGNRKQRLLVVLNDNEMSIAPNVGAMSSYLARLISGQTYAQVKGTTRRILERAPIALEAVRKLEEHLKGMVTPGTLFEEMGFNYIGPIDGHDLETLLITLDNCKKLEGPVLLHVLTKKGFGFTPAMEDPETWHGLGPYDKCSGLPIAASSSLPSYTKIFSQTLCQLAADDERIVAITAAMPTGAGLSAFAKQFPERFFDVGIAEQHAVTFAGGLAVAGLRPVVAIYATFFQRAYDQLIHDICIQNLAIVFCLDRAGIVGADGATHAGSFDISSLRSIPNLTLMAPSNIQELQNMLHTALSLDGPCAIRYPRGSGIDIALETPTTLDIGKAILRRQGDDGLIVAVGTRCADAIEAANLFAEQSKQELAVLDLRFVKPLDQQAIIGQLKTDKLLLTVEEGAAMGGIGEAIVLLAAQHGWHGPVQCLGINDAFPEHGTQKEILRDLGLDTAGILKALHQLSS